MPLKADWLFKQAEACLKRGEVLKADDLFRQCLEATKISALSLHQKNIVRANYEEVHAEACYLRAEEALKQNRHADATRLASEGYALAKKIHGNGNGNTLNILSCLGECYRRSNDNEEAVKTHRKALRYASISGMKPVAVAAYRYDLAQNLCSLGLEGKLEAVNLYRENTRVYQATYNASKPDHPDFIESKLALAETLTSIGDLKKELEYYEKSETEAKDILKLLASTSPQNKSVLRCQLNLARSLLSLHKYSEAKELFETARTTYKSLPESKESSEKLKTINKWLEHCEAKLSVERGRQRTRILATQTLETAPVAPPSISVERGRERGGSFTAQALDMPPATPPSTSRSRQHEDLDLGAFFSSAMEKDEDPWWKRLEKKTFKLLEGEDPSIQRIAGNYKPVKIAILDTGIDGSHGFFQKSRQRIKAYRSFVEPVCSIRANESYGSSSTTMAEKYVDYDGHGTAVASLVLRANPYCHLYIARVAGDKARIEPKHVADAIEYATNAWNVEIISMSFGFSNEKPAIYTAIRAGHDKSVLFFAAAGNASSTTVERRAFPASDNMVFCINASNANGIPSKCNPRNPEDFKNYMVLGENVTVAWPRQLGETAAQPQCTRTLCTDGQSDATRREEGTSMATPIAAATAGLFLEFARQSDQPWMQEIAEKLRHERVMRAVFDWVSDKSTNWRFVQPWELLNVKGGGPKSSAIPEPARSMAERRLYDFLKQSGFIGA